MDSACLAAAGDVDRGTAFSECASNPFADTATASCDHCYQLIAFLFTSHAPPTHREVLVCPSCYRRSTRPSSVNTAATAAPSFASVPRTYLASTCCTARSSLIASPFFFSSTASSFPCRESISSAVLTALHMYLSLEHIWEDCAIIIGTVKLNGRGEGLTF